MKVAVVGAGIAGNVVAAGLHPQHEVTVFEAGGHVGGHTHTHEVEVLGRRVAVDTGFIVYNEQTYPRFVALLERLGVGTQASSMSFSVRNEATGLEYNGTTINTLFAQRRNLLRPSFHRMWRDILRFNKHAPDHLDAHERHDQTLGDYVRTHGYSREFVHDYLLPMAAAIWSAAPEDIGAMPARFLIGFFRNHGMLSVNDRPQWRTITGGSARYAERLVAPLRSRIHLRTAVAGVRRSGGRVQLRLADGELATFDRVVLACHSDQALALLEDPSREEREVLGAIPYQENEAVLHTDASLMPRARLAWAAWNYHVQASAETRVCVTYNMNILQGIDLPGALCVTLNRSEAIDPARILRRVTYHHPVFTAAAVTAQARFAEVSGVRGTYYCGAYWRYGFHEDGVISGERVLAQLAAEGVHAERAVHGLG
jgi:predicted NAD/FAD-binding protein